ncbi:hypothetical protein QBC43DRAFT_313009 [Cladorrhinum sp. PSN259]|nr:hypothetical protein QBC43DRAFT_313009 [Cladorrhinum sp. PSN259]
MNPRIVCRLTPTSISRSKISTLFYKSTCRTVATKTPDDPYPIIGSLDLGKAPINLEDLPELRKMNPNRSPEQASTAKPNTRVQQFGRIHRIGFWQDAKSVKGQGKMNNYGLKVRATNKHVFSLYDDENLGYLGSPLAEKTLWRYLQKKQIPLWVYAQAYVGPDNAIAVVRRKCEKRLKAALYFALAEFGFDKNGRSLDEKSTKVMHGTLVLHTSVPKKIMAMEFDDIVKDLVEVLRKQVNDYMIIKGPYHYATNKDISLGGR